MIAAMESKPVTAWISSEEAAEIMGVTAQTIRRYLIDEELRKELTGYRLPGGHWRVKRADVERWINGR